MKFFTLLLMVFASLCFAQLNTNDFDGIIEHLTDEEKSFESLQGFFIDHKTDAVVVTAVHKTALHLQASMAMTHAVGYTKSYVINVYYENGKITGLDYTESQTDPMPKKTPGSFKLVLGFGETVKDTESGKVTKINGCKWLLSPASFPVEGIADEVKFSKAVQAREAIVTQIIETFSAKDWEAISGEELEQKLLGNCLKLAKSNPLKIGLSPEFTEDYDEINDYTVAWDDSEDVEQHLKMTKPFAPSQKLTLLHWYNNLTIQLQSDLDEDNGQFKVHVIATQWQKSNPIQHVYTVRGLRMGKAWENVVVDSKQAWQKKSDNSLDEFSKSLLEAFWSQRTDKTSHQHRMKHPYEGIRKHLHPKLQVAVRKVYAEYFAAMELKGMKFDYYLKK